MGVRAAAFLARTSGYTNARKRRAFQTRASACELFCEKSVASRRFAPDCQGSFTGRIKSRVSPARAFQKAGLCRVNIPPGFCRAWTLA